MPFGLGKADFSFDWASVWWAGSSREKARASVINPSFQGPNQGHPAAQWRIKQADAQDGQNMVKEDRNKVCVTFEPSLSVHSVGVSTI